MLARQINIFLQNANRKNGTRGQTCGALLAREVGGLGDPAHDLWPHGVGSGVLGGGPGWGRRKRPLCRSRPWASLQPPSD